jgi:hypothetical protein
LHSAANLTYADEEGEGKDEKAPKRPDKGSARRRAENIQDSLVGGTITSIEKELENSEIHYSAEVRNPTATKSRLRSPKVVISSK